MTDYDFIQIARLINREDCIVANTLIGLENTYQIFHKYDEYDFLSLLSVKIRKTVLDDFSYRLLRLCDYLLKNSQNNIKTTGRE